MKVEFTKKNISSIIKCFVKKEKDETVKNIKYIGGGGFGLVFEVVYESGQIQIFKAFKVNESMRAEAQALTELRKYSLLAIPQVYYTISTEEKYPVDIMVMEKIPGKSAAKVHLPFSSKKCKRFSSILINSVGKMHEYPCGTQYGFLGSDKKYDSWKNFYKDFLSNVIINAKEFCFDKSRQSKKIYCLLKKGLDNIDYILSEPVKKPSLVHGDIWLPNIMVDIKTFIPTGIIDPLNSMWGDKEYDLFPLSAPLKKRLKLYQTYKRKFETSKKVDLKIALYALASEVSCNIKSGNRTGKFYYNFLIKRLENQFKIHKI